MYGPAKCRNLSLGPGYTHKGLPSNRLFDAPVPHHHGDPTRRSGADRAAVVRVRSCRIGPAYTAGRARTFCLRARVPSSRAGACANRPRPRPRPRTRTRLLLRWVGPADAPGRGRGAICPLNRLDRRGEPCRSWVRDATERPHRAVAAGPVSLELAAANAGGPARAPDHLSHRPYARCGPLLGRGRSLAPNRPAGRCCTPRRVVASLPSRDRGHKLRQFSL